MLGNWLNNKLEGFRALSKFDNTLELVVNRLFYRESGLAVYRVGDFEILMDHRGGDQNGARHLLTTDMYTRYLARIELPSAANVLDLGANNGGFPLLLARDGVSMRSLCCVEMNPKTYARLVFNTEANLRGVRLFNRNVAVCTDGRSFELALGRGGTGDSIYAGASGSSESRVTVNGVTFDELVESVFGDDPVHLAKVDIEGAEYEILLGDSCQRLDQVERLLIEIHPQGGTPGDVVEALSGRGLRQVDVPGGEKDVYLFTR